MSQPGLAFKGFPIERTDGRIGKLSAFLVAGTTRALRRLAAETGNRLLHPSAIDRVDVPLHEAVATTAPATAAKTEALS